jgi:CBS domain-containing protein
MNTKAKIQDWLRKDLVVVDIDQSIGEAVQMMVESKLSALPVVDAANHCVGVIAATDVLGVALDWSTEIDQLGRASTANHFWLVDKLAHEGLTDLPVRERMSTELVTIAPTASLKDAATKMVENRIHHLVVLGPKRAPVGILSTMDVMRAVAGLPQEAAVH